MRTTWDRVLGWRMQRQFLADRDGPDAVAVTRRLAGVQAQVPSSAAQAIAVRLPAGSAEDVGVEDARRCGTLLRTWAMRGTLHLLAADDAPAVLSLLATARTWDKGSWQREFATAAQMTALEAAVRDVLGGGAVLGRDELVAALIDHSTETGLAEALRSGWGTVLKPLAWQGLLCHAAVDGTRVAFTSPAHAVPDWPGLPDPDTAARTVVPAYLGAHGPASPATFDAWLLRGATPKARLKRWFAEMVEDGTLSVVEIEGSDEGPLYARTADLDALADAPPAPELRLLGAFDQYVLGPGTNDPRIVPPEHRRDVSRAAGWIAPVVLECGRVAGTWSVEDDLPVTPFDTPPDARALAAERAVWRRVLDRSP
jgi:hypothetical protein